jgi:metacaspase-1
MKKLVRITGFILSFLLLVFLLPSMVTFADSNKPAAPDKNKPVSATDVELVRKVSTDKKLPGGAPVSRRRAATGILGAAVSGSRYAVIVGISDYPGTEADLKYCDDDALDMQNVLISQYGYAGDNINLFIDGSATRANILTAIENIPTDAGEIVFFFSGHGTSGKADDGDRELKDEAIVILNNTGDNFSLLWDGELKLAFSVFSPATRIVFIFDSCLSGGMKDDLQGNNRVINMASTETGYSYELDTLQHGEFTYYFTEQGMGLGKANVHDYDGDKQLFETGQVTVEEALDYAKANCTLSTPNICDGFRDDLLP